MSKLESYLERIAKAVEQLNEEPVLQIESGLPICPFCNTINPSVTVEEDSGEGPLSQFVIQPVCQCGNAFWAVPLQWAIFTKREEAEDELNRMAEIFSGNGAGNEYS